MKITQFGKPKTANKESDTHKLPSVAEDYMKRRIK